MRNKQHERWDLVCNRMDRHLHDEMIIGITYSDDEGHVQVQLLSIS